MDSEVIVVDSDSETTSTEEKQKKTEQKAASLEKMDTDELLNIKNDAT